MQRCAAGVQRSPVIYRTSRYAIFSPMTSVSAGSRQYLRWNSQKRPRHRCDVVPNADDYDDDVVAAAAAAGDDDDDETAAVDTAESDLAAIRNEL